MKYADAGVSIDKAEQAMAAIKGLVKKTFTPGVMADFGNFGGLFSLEGLGIRQPVLVSSVDGVGTKLKVSIEAGRASAAGEDIVNHCTDDILVQGARPLFFLDYYATGVLEQDVLVSVVEGLSKACLENGCALLGGETAEMPGFYKPGDFDLAGAIVGVAEKDQIIDGKSIQPGDVLLALPSSGLHTNGYSLARKVLFEKMGYKLNDQPGGLPATLGEVLTAPHRSYLKPLYPLVREKLIKGMIHITGGGFPGNIPRVLPEGVGVTIETASWPTPEIFNLVQTRGEVDFEEMHRTFNMGIGMILVVDKQKADAMASRLQADGEQVYRIGEVIPHASGPRVNLLP